MGQAQRSAARARALAVSAAGAVLALVLPSMPAASLDGPATLALALLALGLLGLARGSGVTGLHQTATVRATASATRRRTPVLAARVADPTHHPLRPRAPGTA